jgi:hypothetical protein
MELVVPLKRWVTDVLKRRENDLKVSNKKMPFIVATSTSKVIKAGANYTDTKTAEEKYKKILTGTDLPNVYYGCVVSNQINPKLSYNSNTTNIGYDLAGKLIIAEETGRKIPTPIITSFDIDTDGRNNALKRSTLVFKCFSIKQFEMFEQFFCKFGMYILVEFGDNSFSDNGISLNKKDYDTFIKEYKTLIDYNTDPQLYFNYLKDIEASNGTYDRFAGIVNSYEYTIDSDGTYNIFLTLIQTNQISLMVPNVYINNNVDIATPNNTGLDTFDEWFLQIKRDLKLDDTYQLEKSKWQNDFFNWGKINNNKFDENSSSEPYITLKLVLDIINHNIKNGTVNSQMFKLNLPVYDVDGKSEEIIPIKIHKNIISKDDVILFPISELVQFDIVDNKISVLDKTTDGRINGKDVLEKRPVRFQTSKTEFVNISPDGDFRLGNALNIFIRYRQVADLWNKTYNKIDFLDAILNLLNEFGYGFYYLAYGNLRENQYSTIVDLNLFSKFEKPDEIYRFKTNTIKSIARNFQFTFEASKAQASYTIYNQDIQLINAVNTSTPTNKSKEIMLPPDFFEETKLYLNMNIDGYYSINQIQFESMKIEAEKKQKNISYSPPTNTKTQEEIESDLYKKISNYSKTFKLKEQIYKTLVFTNESIVLQKLAPSVNKDNTSVTPITISLTIDGLSGFNCGEYFHVDGVPEIYNLLGAFRIINVKHNITDESGWTTTLECKYQLNQ